MKRKHLTRGVTSGVKRGVKRGVTRGVSCALAALMVAGTVGVLAANPAGATEQTYAGTPITEHVGGYAHYDRTMVTHTYDFSVEKLNSYASDTALAMGNRTSAEITDGHLVVKEGKTFSIGSAIGLGDDYGIEEGYLAFTAKLTGGKLYLGLRTSMVDCAVTDRGIWFEMDGGETMRVYEPGSKLEATVPMPVSLSDSAKFRVHEGLDTITLSSGETTLAIIKYTEAGYLAVCGADGTVIAETDKSDIQPTGYFQLTLAELDGWVDDLAFTNVEHTRTVETTDELRLIDYSTWAATDALDRTVADNATTGDPKDNRYVGLFYFLCMTGAGQVVHDNTLDYLTYGADGIKERIETRGGEAYWAQPFFGYYRNTDTWVYRKHAAMLEAAGVDFIYLDVSNALVYPEGHMALFDTWLEMRREGNDTPQIVFFNGDNTKTMESNMTHLFSTIYSEENWDKYSELFFAWEGKPLVFGNISEVSTDLKNTINQKFTVRGCWAWKDQNNYWSWLQEYKGNGTAARPSSGVGGWGRNAQGKYESLSVAMGHHASTSKGRSYVNALQPNNGLGDFEFSSVERAGQGLGFAYQFNAVLNLVKKNVPAEDPFVVLITGWNEWIAGGFKRETEGPLANGTSKVEYVDQFNAEFSRDGEPMRNYDGYGYGDNYYYQMTDFIRQYKGIAKTPVADHQGSVNIYDLSSWEDIELAYLDPLYDTAFRNTISYDAHDRYINGTGRNDLASAKVSQDENAFYFLITASHDLVIDNDENWMNLYLNTDGDMTTGWEGFDYVLNRDRDSFVVTVEKFTGTSYETQVVGGACYYLEGDSMAIRLSKDLLGLTGQCNSLYFKWADNSRTNGDPMNFMDLGDTAPDNRFAYHYLCETYTTTALPVVGFSTDKTTATANGATVPTMKDDFNITVDDSTVNVFYDFTDMKAGTEVSDTEMGKQFEHKGGTGQSTARIKRGTDDHGNHIAMVGFSDLRTWSDIEGSYEFSADIKLEKFGMSAIFVRGEMPGAYTPVNPPNRGTDQVFHYYEWDWYKENGGVTFEPSATAGSGVGIYPGEEGITIRIKRYAEDGLKVASASYTLPYTEQFKPADDGWLNIRCVDDEETVSIYFNNALMCTVKLENPGVVYESDGTGQEYYGKATLFDATGAEVLVVENTRLNSSGSQAAISSRNQEMLIDNVHIAYKTQNTEGSRIETVLSNDLPTGEYTPDTRLTSTLDLGTDILIVEPESETESESALESEDETLLPETTADESVAGESDASTDTGSATTEKGGCASTVGMSMMAVLLGGAALCLAKSKRRD